MTWMVLGYVVFPLVGINRAAYADVAEAGGIADLRHADERIVMRSQFRFT
jgi:hypothetical protein